MSENTDIYRTLSAESTRLDDLLDEIPPETVPAHDLRQALRLVKQANEILTKLAYA